MEGVRSTAAATEHSKRSRGDSTVSVNRLSKESPASGGARPPPPAPAWPAARRPGRAGGAGGAGRRSCGPQPSAREAEARVPCKNSAVA